MYIARGYPHLGLHLLSISSLVWHWYFKKHILPKNNRHEELLLQIFTQTQHMASYNQRAYCSQVSEAKCKGNPSPPEPLPGAWLANSLQLS